MKRKVLYFIVVFIVLSNGLFGQFVQQINLGDNLTFNKTFDFVVLADVPYESECEVKFEKLISRINVLNPSSVFFLGDYKSSKTPCDSNIDNKMLNYFNSFKSPLIYSPGDNEWTDCLDQREKTPGLFQMKRLKTIRSLFFKSDSSLGMNRIFVNRESNLNGFEDFRENAFFITNQIAFASIHVVGSNNNLGMGEIKINEYNKRVVADSVWLDLSFKKAIVSNASALVICLHADMFYPDKGNTGFTRFLSQLRNLVSNCNMPILLINGDSHQFLIDKPLKNSMGGVFDNFTRVQVFGEKQVGAVGVHVDLNTRHIFSFYQIIINK